MTIVNQVMKRLVVDELIDSLEQTLTLTKKTVLERVMPHLYVQGSPTGTVVLRVKSGSVVTAESVLDLTEALTRAGKTLDNYHGFISFAFAKPPILAPGTYTIELAVSSYSFDSDTFVGWVKLPSDSSQTSSLTLPHDLRVVEIRAP